METSMELPRTAEPTLEGTVFKVTPGGALTILYSFGTTSTDGSNPKDALFQAADGNFYGTTTRNGSTVFRITPGGTLTTIYSSNSDMFYPGGSLIQANDGNFYGTYNTVVFKITPRGSLTTFVLSGTPNAGLIQATDGNLYGTTKGCGGTVFKITAGGVLTTIYSFPGNGSPVSPLPA